MGKEKTVSNVQMKIWNLGFTCVFISYLAMSVGQKLVNPLISRYTNYLGGSATIIGLVSSSFAIVALACKIFSGPVIDTFKKKSCLLYTSFDNKFFSLQTGQNIVGVCGYEYLIFDSQTTNSRNVDTGFYGNYHIFF